MTDEVVLYIYFSIALLVCLMPSPSLRDTSPKGRGLVGAIVRPFPRVMLLLSPFLREGWHADESAWRDERPRIDLLIALLVKFKGFKRDIPFVVCGVGVKGRGNRNPCPLRLLSVPFFTQRKVHKKKNNNNFSAFEKAWQNFTYRVCAGQVY